MARSRAPFTPLAIWLAASAGLAVLIGVFGSPMPYWDEWELVPQLTGDEPVTFAWLWSLHNEHRLPLLKIVYLVMGSLTAGDSRAMMCLSVGMQSVAALALMAAARRIRGRSSWTDCLFPLLLLHLGHAENALVAFGFQYASASVVLCLLLAAFAGRQRALDRATALAIFGGLILLALCGANGLVLVPALAIWLALASLRHGLTEIARLRFAVPVAAVPLVLVAAYFHRYHGNPGHPPPAGLRRALSSATEVLSIAFGPGGGLRWPGAGVVALLAFLAAFGALLRWWARHPQDRMHVEALLAFGVALGVLVLTVAWGRSGFPPGAARVARYSVLAAPVLCWAQLVWTRAPWPTASRLAQGLLAALALFAYAGSFRTGIEQAHDRYDKLRAYSLELWAGTPVLEAARRHAANVYPDPRILAERTEMLRRARIGPFRPALRPGPRPFPY